MGKKKSLIADGITPVVKTTFQSFTTQVRSSRGGLVITIPSQITEHLELTKDTILEIALREVPFRYAREKYKIDFFPHDVVCPECEENGRLSHFAHNYVVVTHRKKGKRGMQKICYPSKEVINQLIQKYELEHNLIVSPKKIKRM